MHDGWARTWLLVLGMHRSGTSAVAGTFGSLGCVLPRSDDRVDWPESNPEHFESLSASVHDEELLCALGGAWDAPPAFPRHWIHTAAVTAGGRSRTLLLDVFDPNGPALWKDPRLCLLLPYWRVVLGDPLGAVLVWRSPPAVAASLRARDQMPEADGLALWERYNRMALTALVGLPVLVADYDAAVARPDEFWRSGQRWLRAAGGGPGSSVTDEAGATPIVAALRRQAPTRSGTQSQLSPEQQGLWDQLRSVTGTHDRFPALPLGRETPGTELRLDARRRLARSRRDLERATTVTSQIREELRTAREALDAAQLHATRLQQSTSWRLTRPLRWATAVTEQISHRRHRPNRPDRPPSSAGWSGP
jgi:hypothetical protein